MVLVQEIKRRLVDLPFLSVVVSDSPIELTERIHWPFPVHIYAKEAVGPFCNGCSAVAVFRDMDLNLVNNHAVAPERRDDLHAPSNAAVQRNFATGGGPGVRDANVFSK